MFGDEIVGRLKKGVTECFTKTVFYLLPKRKVHVLL